MKLFFLVKSNTANLGTALIKCQIIRIYILSDIGSKEFCWICHWWIHSSHL